MKKAWKKAALTLMVGVMIFSLCSCVSLKDIKENQAFWTDAAQTSIIWNETEYILLDGAEDSGISPIYDYEQNLFVTDPDVPALLSDMYGTRFFISTDKVFLMLNGNYYCRADRHREINQRIAKGFVPETMGFDYNDEFYTEKFQVLTEAEYAVLLNLLETARAWTVNEFPEDYNYVSSVYQCSKDGLFREYYTDLISTGDRYYFEFYEKDLWEGDQTLLCLVPEEDEAKVEAIFEKAMTQEPW